MFVKLRHGILVLALAGAGAVACDPTAQQALDCGKTAISIAGDVQDLKDSATNVGQITDESRRQNTIKALKKVGSDAEKLKGSGNKGDLGKRLDDLNTAVSRAEDAATSGKQVDVGPVLSAAAEVGKLCGS
ncbi:hypothetical protein C7C46_30895 [Streptomyces tateyamensis]|uniref:Secreted protein n=1 Tax=Streptomyces tateyamensis TaxID=565073 RepID=A0A2V4MXA5_9ACTN|nr:hypothetical protein [Streptomyces tateyamensis]PYC66772.1 hypothetical protein C7C46_30895 [Streptomyces tateyamensis]